MTNLKALQIALLSSKNMNPTPILSDYMKYMDDQN